MKFTVTSATSYEKARKAIWQACTFNDKKVEFNTPNCVISTQTGSIPNLTQVGLYLSLLAVVVLIISFFPCKIY